MIHANRIRILRGAAVSIVALLAAACTPPETQSVDTFPQSIERPEHSAAELAPFLQQNIYKWVSDKDHLNERVVSAFAESDLQLVRTLRQQHQNTVSIVPGRMVPAVSDCVNKWQTHAPMRQASGKCMAEHTAMLVQINDEDDQWQGIELFPRQPISQLALDRFGTPSKMCGEEQPAEETELYLCSYYPVDGFGKIEGQNWQHAFGFELLPDDITGSALASYNSRPFATATDRAYEQAFVELYRSASGGPSNTEYPVLPGRFLPAIRSCGEHYSWVGRNYTGTIKLEDFLVLVREIMPTAMGDDETLDYMPDMPVVLVSLVPQGTVDNPADPKLQENCFVDPRDDTIFANYSGPTPLDAPALSTSPQSDLSPQQQKPAEQGQ